MNGKRGLINSPLRQLGLQLSRSKRDKDQNEREEKSVDIKSLSMEDPYIDRSSVYSYDSVHTSGRLLDRLDIENISLENGNQNSRHSVIWIDSNSATEEDNLSSFDDLSIYQEVESQSTHAFDKRGPIIHDMNVRELPVNVVLKDNQSVESFKVDIKRLSMNSHGADFDHQLVSLANNSEIGDSQESENQEQYDNIFGDDDSISSSDIVTKSLSDLNSTYTTKSELALEDTYSINNCNSHDISAETRIKLSSQLRKASKDREASYQLQIAANIPNNHPKAMFLYGMALRYGQGVKQSHIQSIKWICKCILVDTSTNSTTLIEKLNKLELDVLISFAINTIDSPVDVYDLLDVYSKLPRSKMSKIINQSKKQPTTISLAYHELGVALINGWGNPNKFELNGMTLLSKSASMGNVNSMIKLGDIWSIKSKTHKKDLMKAAAWLRLSELFEVKTIGNSWIYKDKYMSRQKK